MMARAGRPAMFVPARAAVRGRGARAINSVDRGLAFCCLVVLLTLIIALPSLLIGGIPVRSVVACGMLVLLGILYPEVAAEAFRRTGPLLAIAGGLALLGIFVSAVNGTEAERIARPMIEMNIQPAIVVVLASMVAQMCGPRACVIAIVGTVAAGAVIALLQALGVEAAWALRRLLASVQTQAMDDPDRLEVGRRAIGLSYSTIQLATQLCLAFVVFVAVRDKERRTTYGEATADPAVVPALLLFVGASAASGNRSPILGALLFLAVYGARRRGAWIPILLMVGALLLLLAWPLIVDAAESGQVRVLRADDQSALGRMPMTEFGLRLFAANPLGYGYAFRPFEHWTAYWDQLYTVPGAIVIQTRHLHNYLLNMLNTYGIGLLLLAPLVYGLLRRSSASLIFFIPYIVHIMFHNSGPFWNDMIIWFVIPAISVAGDRQPARGTVRVLPGQRRVARHLTVDSGGDWWRVRAAGW